jgi:hypothetical protein
LNAFTFFAFFAVQLLFLGSAMSYRLSDIRKRLTAWADGVSCEAVDRLVGEPMFDLHPKPWLDCPMLVASNSFRLTNTGCRKWLPMSSG